MVCVVRFKTALNGFPQFSVKEKVVIVSQHLFSLKKQVLFLILLSYR